VSIFVEWRLTVPDKGLPITIEGDHLVVMGQRHSIPNVTLGEILAAGANGIVLSGQHTYIHRPVAIKIWLPLRSHHRRNKLSQGLSEINKAAAVDSQNVGRIYDAGVLPNTQCPYAVMEFAPGITCHDWLIQYRPNLLSRLRFAESLELEVFSLAFNEILHGDLHTRNIIVAPPYKSPLCNGIQAPQFKIIDFGTSFFSGKEFSKRRHWRIFTNTMVELLRPFNIRVTNPNIDSMNDIHRMWAIYMSFYETIVDVLRLGFGINATADPQDDCKWARGPISGNSRVYDSCTQMRNEVARLCRSGELLLTPEAIGVLHDTQSFGIENVIPDRPLKTVFSRK
jgi:tRNA A-37 threonylcarbamoyl transferase component Bud32